MILPVLIIFLLLGSPFLSLQYAPERRMDHRQMSTLKARKNKASAEDTIGGIGDSSAEEDFKQQLRALFDGTRIPDDRSTGTTSDNINKQKERVKSNIQELLEISKTITGESGSIEGLEQKFNKVLIIF